LIVPANPLRLATVIVEVALDPNCTFCELGLAAIAKSGVGGWTTVKVATVWCDRLPLVPVTLTPKVVVGVPKVVTNDTVAFPVPPELSVTVFGLTLQVGQLGQSGGGEVERLTVPANPKLVSTIVEVAVDPACTFCELGLAVMEKSGIIAPPNVAVWTDSESVMFTFTTDTHVLGTLVPEHPA
jgi:hypothetical protein